MFIHILPLFLLTIIIGEKVNAQVHLKSEFRKLASKRDQKKQKTTTAKPVKYDEDTGIYTASVCEDKTLNISCPKRKTIEPVTAFYGRNSSKICPTFSEWEPCSVAQAFNIVSKKCKLEQECEVEASADVFGDPCEDTEKYLKVSFKCVKELKKVNVTSAMNDDGEGKESSANSDPKEDKQKSEEPKNEAKDKEGKSKPESKSAKEKTKTGKRSTKDGKAEEKVKKNDVTVTKDGNGNAMTNRANHIIFKVMLSATIIYLS